MDDATLAPVRQLVEELGGEYLRPDMTLAATERTVQGLDLVKTADVLLANRFSPEYLEFGQSLRWIHSPMAGVNHLLTPTLVKSKIVLTNGAGMNSIPIAEHVFSMLLAFTRRLLTFHDRQKEGRWQQMTNSDELYGKTVGIVGYGSIGRAVAQRAKGFDMQVWATKRHPTEPGLAADPYLDKILAPTELPALLAQSDFVVLSAALTSETKGLIGAQELATMKKSAYLVNIARGQLIDETALLEALEKGIIAGAGLDVVVKEPLPAESPLWKAPNLLITAHSSWNSPYVRGRNIQLFCDNLRRYVGQQPLMNVVDKELGY